MLTVHQHLVVSNKLGNKLCTGGILLSVFTLFQIVALFYYSVCTFVSVAKHTPLLDAIDYL